MRLTIKSSFRLALLLSFSLLLAAQPALAQTASSTTASQAARSFLGGQYSTALAELDQAIASYVAIWMPFEEKKLELFTAKQCTPSIMKELQDEDDPVVAARLDMKMAARRAAYLNPSKPPSNSVPNGEDLLTERQSLNLDYAKAERLSDQVEQALRECFLNSEGVASNHKVSPLYLERLRMIRARHVAMNVIHDINDPTFTCPVYIKELDWSKAVVTIWEQAGSPFSEDQEMSTEVEKTSASIAEAEALLANRCEKASNGDEAIAETAEIMLDCDSYFDRLAAAEAQAAQNPGPRKKRFARNLFCEQPGWHRR